MPGLFGKKQTAYGSPITGDLDADSRELSDRYNNTTIPKEMGRGALQGMGEGALHGALGLGAAGLGVGALGSRGAGLKEKLKAMAMLGGAGAGLGAAAGGVGGGIGGGLGSGIGHGINRLIQPELSEDDARTSLKTQHGQHYKTGSVHALRLMKLI